MGRPISQWYLERSYWAGGAWWDHSGRGQYVHDKVLPGAGGGELSVRYFLLHVHDSDPAGARTVEDVDQAVRFDYVDGESVRSDRRRYANYLTVTSVFVSDDAK